MIPNTIIFKNYPNTNGKTNTATNVLFKHAQTTITILNTHGVIMMMMNSNEKRFPKLLKIIV